LRLDPSQDLGEPHFLLLPRKRAVISFAVCQSLAARVMREPGVGTQRGVTFPDLEVTGAPAHVREHKEF
jgi:hypothetical protein